ncbi:glucuronate isomerase [Seonamhaeicola maritimus]|uniref:Uronate isomerase n=1 Tax=Seonamhaeicola maritimus TaxID=2591822 RepID=A0A5C7GI51_9FLAO|nr:glucuronate isomerase [Seonamhaeicola maritimus]TXG37298.1 glucuronate isomerase [Seonamhaeicola maritimus]
MSSIISKNFIADNFLLESKEAEMLYHDYAKTVPIIDYHNHLSAKEIAENKPIGNITKAWLSGDHYKWRGMRANGIEEYYISGDAPLEEKFEKWAETVPNTLRNPLFHWTQLELKRYFNIDTVLQPNNASEIYEEANSILENRTPAQLLEQMNVEVVCTTDDPTDDLKYHQQIAKANYFTKVYPTFRPDELFFIGEEKFNLYLEKLSACVNYSIDSYEVLLKAIDERIEFFHKNGCRLSDYGISGAFSFVGFNDDEITTIFEKNPKSEGLTELEIQKYRSSLLLHLGKKYHEKGWTQQYHLGVIRNNNERLKELVGADAGCDSIADYPIIEGLSKFLNALDRTDQLAKTITYNLNPAQNETFASMMGNFNTGGIPGKMQWGAAWWFLDQKDGIEKQLNVLSNMGLLSKFIGMLTDSRSFLSFPRHEYFRRILCNVIADDLNKRLVPNDTEFLGKMIQDICYNNAKNYFNFK